MLMNLQLILPLPLVASLDNMFAQNFGYALCVLQRCGGGDGAGFGGGVAGEFGASVGAGGVEGGCVVCEG